MTACRNFHRAQMEPIADPRLLEIPPTDFGGQFNPVRANDQEGVHEFLATMRCAGGDRPKYRLEEKGISGPNGRPVDRYEILCDDVVTRIFFDPNFEGDASWRAVPGFEFEPPTEE